MEVTAVKTMVASRAAMKRVSEEGEEGEVGEG